MALMRLWSFLNLNPHEKNGCCRVVSKWGGKWSGGGENVRGRSVRWVRDVSFTAATYWPSNNSWEEEDLFRCGKTEGSQQLHAPFFLVKAGAASLHHKSNHRFPLCHLASGAVYWSFKATRKFILANFWRWKCRSYTFWIRNCWHLKNIYFNLQWFIKLRGSSQNLSEKVF